MALAALGFCSDPVHEPVHGTGRPTAAQTPDIAVRHDQAPGETASAQLGWVHPAGKVPTTHGVECDKT
jgi:hypothetical protein